MNATMQRTITLGLILVLGIALIGSAQESALGDKVPLRLLLVDGTKTFASTARVGALAGAIRSTGVVELDVRFNDTACPYDDPLAFETDLPATPYDIVVFIPRGIDDGSAETIWAITGILPWTSPARRPAVAALTRITDQVFTGLASTADPTEDLWPAFLASLYQTQGWLR